MYKHTERWTSSVNAAKSLQLCPTLFDPIDGSPPGSPIPGILQARTLEWVAISFSNAWKWKVKVRSLSRVWPSTTPWTAAYQAPPSMGFSRQSTGVGGHCLLHQSIGNCKLKTTIRYRYLSTKLGKIKRLNWMLVKNGASGTVIQLLVRL